MMEQSFSLIPFPAPKIPEITLKGRISLQKNFLALQYSMIGETWDILLPSRSVRPARKNDLWKSTCFELFLAIKDQPQYWEFNMSPTGVWNIYHMDAYRRVGFREEILIPQLPIEIQREADWFTLNVLVDLSSIVPEGKPLEVGITAIIQTNDGNETYWALTHPHPYVDFHLRESFILRLPPESQLSEPSAPGQLTTI